MTDELLPCPFCGGTDLTIADSVMGGKSVQCLNPSCEIEGPGLRGTDQEAVNTWNDRAILPEPAPVVRNGETVGWVVAGVFIPTRMAVCPECGNKRCPKANNRFRDCTNSNEPGQPGSLYE